MVQLIEYAAVVSSAIYAVGLAGRHGMDPVGTLSTAMIVSFGGGTLRDLFLARRPLFWIEQEEYVVVVLTIAAVGAFFPKLAARSERWLTVPDALGLGLFAVSGTAIARQEGAGPLVSSLLGVVTGTFGGVIGDVVCNRVPSLFRPAPLYATCAFVGAWCLLIPVWAGADSRAVQPFAVAAVVTLRLIAVRRDWTMKPVGDSRPADELQSSGVNGPATTRKRSRSARRPSSSAQRSR
ncbi:MAG: trimeric intracellular cation channel family protein [Planctomycetota bacterium]